MAYKMKDKIYRNLPEQVEKNAQDIDFILTQATTLNEFGIRVVGEVASTDDLPTVAEYKEDNEDWEYGDAFAVGTESPYELYILTRANAGHLNDYWFDIGEFPLAGPQGETGATGERGPIGPAGKPCLAGEGVPSGSLGGKTNQDGTSYINTLTGDVYSLSITDDGETWTWTKLGNIRGPQGVQGIQGIQGIQGATGATGATGERGPAGVVVNVVGTVASVENLPTVTTVDFHDAYLVGASYPYRLYIVKGDPNDSTTWVWLDCGPFTSGGEYTKIVDENATYKANLVEGTTPTSGNLAAYDANAKLHSTTPISTDGDGIVATKGYVDKFRVYVLEQNISSYTGTSTWAKEIASSKPHYVLLNGNIQVSNHSNSPLQNDIGGSAANISSGKILTLKGSDLSTIRYVDLAAGYSNQLNINGKSINYAYNEIVELQIYSIGSTTASYFLTKINELTQFDAATLISSKQNKFNYITLSSDTGTIASGPLLGMADDLNFIVYNYTIGNDVYYCYKNVGGSSATYYEYASNVIRTSTYPYDHYVKVRIDKVSGAYTVEKVDIGKEYVKLTIADNGNSGFVEIYLLKSDFDAFLTAYSAAFGMTITINNFDTIFNSIIASGPDSTTIYNTLSEVIASRSARFVEIYMVSLNVLMPGYVKMNNVEILDSTGGCYLSIETREGGGATLYLYENNSQAATMATVEVVYTTDTPVFYTVP